MSKFTFVSSEQFPSDEYTKEVVYLEIDAPARVAFVRKPAKNGGVFWTVANISVTGKEGKKEFYPAYLQDSNFLEKDIKAFLQERKWERRATFTPPAVDQRNTQSNGNDENQEELPF
jgi:hypothetical protein